MTYKHFFWDFDGTLFDTYPAIVAAFQSALREFGVEGDSDDIYHLMMTTITYAVEVYTERYHLGPAFKQRFRRLQRPFEQAMAKPFPGLRAVCQEIVSKGGKNYLYTHRDSEAILYLKRYGVDMYFTDYVTSDDKDKFPPKPAPDALLALMARNGVSPKEAVMIGDRSIDILAGKNAGMTGCYFDPQHSGLVTEGDFIIHALSELLKLQLS